MRQSGGAGFVELVAQRNCGECSVCCVSLNVDTKEFQKLPGIPCAHLRKYDKLWKVHFRNVTAPVPDFTETFINNGYGDLARVIRTLVDVVFRGNLIADHVPTMVGGRNVAWAYSIGYIKALYKMAGDAQPRSRRQLA